MTLQSDSAAVPQQLNSLISAVRGVVQRGMPDADTAEAVAQELSDYLAARSPIPEQYRQADPDRYIQHLIHTEADGSFSIVALVWLPGQSTPVHDHLAWCVTGVAEGQEHEQRYELHGQHSAEPHLVGTEQVTNQLGDVSALAPPGDIHRVTNSSDSLTVSLHIYGADIATHGSSIRRAYNHTIAGW